MALKVRPDGMLDPAGKYLNPLTGKPYDAYYSRFSMGTDPKGWSLLKAYQDRNELLNKIHSKQILMVSLPTGTGKTVIVPRLLFHYFGYDKKIIVTTPRQQTTAKAGAFAAKCFNVPLFVVDEKGNEKEDPTVEKGKENRIPTGLKIVGFKHGDSSDFKDSTTKLLFTTDSTVKGMITGGDEDLKEYSGIVIDEVHERSVSIDIVISLVMDILTRRKDFKIIFMSATMDLTIFTNYFKKLGQEKNYNIYEVPEAPTTYKIEYIKIPKPLLKNANKIIDSVYAKINEVMLEFEKTKDNGDILAFVTSDSDIKKLINKINQNIKNYSEDNRPLAIKMASSSSEDEMKNSTKNGALKNIKPTANAPKGYARKIIIATPMAESSITFEDELKFVIDTGLAYSISYDADKYCYVTGKNYVKQANIAQRCGRTGRNCNGTCIQLYTDKELSSFDKYTVPEIRSKDFTKELLSIMKLPKTKNSIIESVIFVNNMIEPIENFKPFLKVAYKNIKEMDFIDENYKLTELGNICSEFNKYDIKIAKMIIGSYFFNCIDLSIMLGAILHFEVNFAEIFKSLTDEEKKDPKMKKKYEDNIKRFIKPEGDHISLLIIYYMFLQNNPGSSAFAEKNGLDYVKLTSIQQVHNELYQVIYKQDIRTRVNILSKFTTITNQFQNYPSNNINNPYNAQGGGKSNGKKNDKYKLRKYKLSKIKNTIKLKSTKKINTNKINTNKINTNKINTNKINKYNKFKIHKKNVLSRDSSKGSIQNNNSGIKLLNRNSKNGGGTSFKLHTNKYKRKSGLKNELKDYVTHLNLNGGGSEEINFRRRLRYMDLFTLYNLQSQRKSITQPKSSDPSDIFTRVIACLYYGYSTNIACYSGTGKDYIVKFSKIKGTPFNSLFKTSTFDYKFPDIPPNFLIYNTFKLPQEFGKLEQKGSLNIVSILDTKHLNYFFDLKKIMEQVMSEIK
jgi:HrpA-like RNA helicase